MSLTATGSGVFTALGTGVYTVGGGGGGVLGVGGVGGGGVGSAHHVDTAAYATYKFTLTIHDASEADVTFSNEEQIGHTLKLTNPSDANDYYTIPPGRSDANTFQSNTGWGITNGNAGTNIVEFLFNIIKTPSGSEAFETIDGSQLLLKGTSTAFDVGDLVDFVVTRE